MRKNIAFSCKFIYMKMLCFCNLKTIQHTSFFEVWVVFTQCIGYYSFKLTKMVLKMILVSSLSRGWLLFMVYDKKARGLAYCTTCFQDHELKKKTLRFFDEMKKRIPKPRRTFYWPGSKIVWVFSDCKLLTQIYLYKLVF